MKSLGWRPSLLALGAGQSSRAPLPGMVTLQRANARGQIAAKVLTTASEWAPCIHGVMHARIGCLGVVF